LAQFKAKELEHHTVLDTLDQVTHERDELALKLAEVSLFFFQMQQ
jgi:hypothetical protein